ncbi:hypothetical protein HNQ50_002547 [Silvimonas terrae]|uniref:PH (Pleckstrin Homology) domain-containing protein n=1 Tax=Silvimonas terrae TaxID=300266 RepID=A0A840RFK7_9NEIS|nr:hypothetical protein [Silvimonas terrae]MBB5191817.1 hypothetical protein [Silvimonas terrae]
MQLISSSPFFMKKVFPFIWFGFLVIFFLGMFASGQASQDPMILLGPVFMAIFGVVLMRKLVWGLADEVYDCGDQLLVRKGQQEEYVALANIINVSTTFTSNPPRITLRLAQPGLFGDEIAFSPPTPIFRLNPFSIFQRNPLAEDLMVRVDKARRLR